MLPCCCSGQKPCIWLTPTPSAMSVHFTFEMPTRWPFLSPPELPPGSGHPHLPSGDCSSHLTASLLPPQLLQSVLGIASREDRSMLRSAQSLQASFPPHSEPITESLPWTAGPALPGPAYFADSSPAPPLVLYASPPATWPPTCQAHLL